MTDPAGSQLPSVIFLVGFMGAGKTTVGQVLARKIDYRFFDLDQIIEEQTGKVVREIFAREGEAEFRRVERAALESCARGESAVIALGGGAYVSEENRKTAAAIGVTVWLDCPLQVCLRRVEGDRSRPLLRGEAEMSELFEKRLPSYAQADMVVKCNDDPPETVAESILILLPSVAKM